MRISVQPSNNIFTELGNNTYDYKDLLSELIDNSLAARIPAEVLHVKIDIFVDKELAPKKFVIADDAAGIPIDRIGPAISPAAIVTTGSLNEHGLGMKQAVASLGRLGSLVTKTPDRDLAISVREFKFGDIEANEVEFEKPRGTTITVGDLKPTVITNPTNITRTLIPHLGARYRRFLKPDNPVLDLTLEIRNVDTGDSNYRWEVKEVKPIYFHPSTRDNRPVINPYPIEGNGWRAELTFGYAPKDRSEYEELGLEPPNKFHPYRVALATQGLDVFFHDRVILFHQLSELGLVGQQHPNYNYVRGEITLVSGFATAITKNSIRDDQHFRECVETIRDILDGSKPGPGNRKEDYLQHKSYPEDIPEDLLRDRLVEWLKNNPMQKKSEVLKEYAVEGVEGFIDILADKEAWELKKEQAGALDVYQLFMYMDVGDIAKGFLVAKDFTPGALVAAKVIKEKHGKDIVLAQKDQFPINQQPNAQEREDYY